MRLDRKALLAFAFLVAPVGAATSGCLSGDDNANPAPAPDASVPAVDASHPDVAAQDQAAPVDARDAALPPVDSTVPSDDAGDANVQPDVTDSASPDVTDSAQSDVTDSSAPDVADADEPDAFDSAFPDAGTTLLRIAWLDVPGQTTIRPRSLGQPAQPPAGTKYDVCFKLHGTDVWAGPFLSQQGSPGFDPYDVTKYYAIAPAQYDVRVITITSDAGAPTCDLPDAGADGGAQSDFTNLPALVAGQALTLAVTPPLASQSVNDYANVVPLVDEGAPFPGKVKVRFVNTTGLQNAFDFGLGGGAVFTRVLSADGATGIDPTADPNGYVEIDPFTQLDLSMQLGGVDYGASGAIDAPAGTVLSAFAAGGPGVSTLLVCLDGQPSTKSPTLTKCTPPSSYNGAQPPLPQTRFGNFIADPSVPQVDLCVKYASQAAFGGPIGGPLPDGGVGGLPVGSVSERYGLHAGFTFDVRVVAAGASTCVSPLGPDTQYTPPTGGTVIGVTVAFTGYLTPPVDAGVVSSDAGSDGGSGLPSVAFAAVPFNDIQPCVEAAPVVRVVNLVASQAKPQTVSVGGASGWVAANVPYGGFLTSAPEDACGYQPITPGQNAVLFAVGQPWSFTSTGSTLDTLYVFGSGHVLDCVDGDSSETACHVLPVGG